MSEWISEKLATDDINSGNQFGTASNTWTLEEINAFICGILYAQQNADDAKEIASGAGETSASAESLATAAKELAESAVATATSAKSSAESAVTKSEEAVTKADSAIEIAGSANTKSTLAVETAESANEKASDALSKVENFSAEAVENGGEISAEVETLEDGNLKLVLYNAKGDTGEKGDKGDGSIPIYNELGENTDGAINQKVVTENINQINETLATAILETDQINISGGEA
ncbi:MAG: hypothetical protein R3Y32_03395 [Bacillota bacterium]